MQRRAYLRGARCAPAAASSSAGKGRFRGGAGREAPGPAPALRFPPAAVAALCAPCGVGGRTARGLSASSPAAAGPGSAAGPGGSGGRLFAFVAAPEPGTQRPSAGRRPGLARPGVLGERWCFTARGQVVVLAEVLSRGAGRCFGAKLSSFTSGQTGRGEARRAVLVCGRKRDALRHPQPLVRTPCRAGWERR